MDILSMQGGGLTAALLVPGSLSSFTCRWREALAFENTPRVYNV